MCKITSDDDQNRVFCIPFNASKTTPLYISSPKKSNIMTTGKIVLSIAAGVAAGVVLGVLFAPDKGSATRKKIVQKRDDVVDGLGEKVNELLDTVTNKLEAVKKQSAKMLANGEAKLEALEEEFSGAINSKLN